MKKTIKINKFVFVTFTCLFVLSSCMSLLPAPEGAIPGQISVTIEAASPYWRIELAKYFPKALNDYAHYEIVNGSNNSPFLLKVKLINTDSFLSGVEKNGDVSYKTRVEVSYQLEERKSGAIVWSGEAWASHGNGAKAIAKTVASKMEKEGLLKPAYYSRNAQSSNP